MPHTTLGFTVGVMSKLRTPPDLPSMDHTEHTDTWTVIGTTW